MPHLDRAFAQFDRTWAYTSTLPTGTGTVNMFPGASDVAFYRPGETQGLARKVPRAPMKAAQAARAFGARARRGAGAKRSLRLAMMSAPHGSSTGAIVPPVPEGSGAAPTSPATAAVAAGAPANAVAAVGGEAAAQANSGAAVVKTPPELKSGFLGLPGWAVWGAIGVVGFVVVRGLVK